MNDMIFSTLEVAKAHIEFSIMDDIIETRHINELNIGLWLALCTDIFCGKVSGNSGGE